MFASRLPLAEAYVDLLAHAGTERGLLGPREVPRLWDRHVLNCAVLTDLIEADSSVADVGSGAGLPGITLAIRRPDLTVTLVEPLLRRATFLEEAAAELELDNVSVRRARAEQVPERAAFDVVTSRAVAPLQRLLGWSLPLAARNGQVLAIKGRSAGTEIDSLGLDEAGRGLVSVVELEVPQIVVPTTVVRVESALARHIPWERSRGGEHHRLANRHRRH